MQAPVRAQIGTSLARGRVRGAVDGRRSLVRGCRRVGPAVLTHASRLAVTKLLLEHGLVILFALVAVESAGVPLPGETALIAAAVLAHKQRLPLASRR